MRKLSREETLNKFQHLLSDKQQFHYQELLKKKAAKNLTSRERDELFVYEELIFYCSLKG